MLKYFHQQLNWLEHWAQQRAQRHNIHYWLHHGRLPWERGYVEYKEQQIEQVLADAVTMDTFTRNAVLPEHFGERLDERIVEFPWMIAKLAQTGPNLLDAGSTVNHSYILRQPVFQNKHLTIITLAPEADNYWQQGISYLYGDLRSNPLRDGSVDVITCISTLEHIGMDNTMYSSNAFHKESNHEAYRQVIQEFKRILKPGGSLLLTIPYGVYENCGFQQVFDRAMIQQVIATFGGTIVEQRFYKYALAGWQLADQTDCDHCRYFNIHATKQFDSDYAAAARAVACLHLIRS